MNKTERKARFTEIMATIELLGDPEQDGYNPAIPNGSLGLSDSNLKIAILSQAVREREEFVGNLINALAKTGFDGLAESHNDDKPISEDDIGAVTMAIHIAWAFGAFSPLAMMLGAWGQISNALDIDTPDEMLMILRPNTPIVEGAKKHDPYKVLEQDLDEIISDLIKKGLSDE